jgi:hypothetical protein
MSAILTTVEAAHPEARSRPTALVEMCTRSLPISGAGLTLMTEEGAIGTVAVTDGPARELEDLQFTLGEGPCVDASRTGRPVLQPDLARTGPARWPVFADRARTAGLGAVFALPLRVGAIRLGVLDLYRATPGDLTRAQLTEALAFADAATLLLLDLQARDSGAGEMLDPPPLDDRAEVHQATGVVSVLARVSLKEALLLLRARAYSDQRPLRDLARDVLAGAVRFEPEGRTP